MKLAKCLHQSNSGYEHSEVVGNASQQRHQCEWQAII